MLDVVTSFYGNNNESCHTALCFVDLRKAFDSVSYESLLMKLSHYDIRGVAYNLQRWSRGHKARGQGQGHGHKKNSRPRPRTEPLEAKALDKGHRRKCFPKKKGLKFFFQAKKVFKQFFSGDLHVRKTEKGLRKFFARFLAFFNKILLVQEIELSSS